MICIIYIGYLYTCGAQLKIMNSYRRISIYVVVAMANNKKKAPEKLANARKLFQGGNSNAALKELIQSVRI